MARGPEYYFKETLQGLRRNGLVAFAVETAAFIALFLVGGAILVSRQVNLMIDFTTHNVEVSVFLNDDISSDVQSNLQNILTSMPEVARVNYESKQDALARFKVEFANQPALVENVSPDA